MKELAEMGKLCVADLIHYLRPEFEVKILMRMKITVLLAMLPDGEGPEPIEVVEGFDSETTSYLGADGLRLPHRRRAPSRHRR